MLFKNAAGQGLYVFAKDTTTGVGKTGDAANMTVNLTLDGGALAPATTPLSETGNGLYWLALTQAETNADVLALEGTSSTANVAVDPIEVLTTAGAIPKAVAGGLNGLPTVDASNYIAGIQGAVANILDDLAGASYNGSVHALDQQATLTDQYNSIKGLFDTEQWSELTAVPGATPTTTDLLMWFYMIARNLLTDNRGTGQQTMHNDAGTPIGVAARSDNGTIFTREKFVDFS